MTFIHCRKFSSCFFTVMFARMRRYHFCYSLFVGMSILTCYSNFCSRLFGNFMSFTCRCKFCSRFVSTSDNSVAAISQIVTARCFGVERGNPKNFSLVKLFNGAFFDNFDRKIFPAVFCDSHVNTRSGFTAVALMLSHSLLEIYCLSNVNFAVELVYYSVNDSVHNLSFVKLRQQELLHE